MAGIYFGLLMLGAALAPALAAVGAGIGEGLVFSAAIQSIARQPDAESLISRYMYITFAIVETLFIFGFAIWAIMYFPHQPTAAQLNQMLSH